MATELRFAADRVCVVLLSGVGDVVHGLPVVNALKRDDPRRHITWVVEPAPSWLLRPHPAVDEVIVFERARGWRGVHDLWRTMRDRRFDLTLNLNIYFKSVFPTVFSDARVRVGIDRARARDVVWLFSTHPLPPRPWQHTQDIFLEFLQFLGLEDVAVEWRLTLTGEERRAQAEFFERWGGGGERGGERAGDRPVVAVVPASANPAKDWIAERWAEVLAALESDFGFRVVLLGGPSERELRIAQATVDRSGAHPVWELGCGIRRLLWLIAGSQLVIAPDTGPVHVARALEVPVIGLYGHSNPWRVGPYRKFQDLWVDRYTDEGEEPDPGRVHWRAGRMERITVQDVLDRVERAVKQYIIFPARRA